MYLAGTSTGEGNKYPTEPPSTAIHIERKGSAAATAAVNGAYLPNTNPLAERNPIAAPMNSITALRMYPACRAVPSLSRIRTKLFSSAIILFPFRRRRIAGRSAHP